MVSPNLTPSVTASASSDRRQIESWVAEIQRMSVGSDRSVGASLRARESTKKKSVPVFSRTIPQPRAKLPSWPARPVQARPPLEAGASLARSAQPDGNCGTYWRRPDWTGRSTSRRDDPTIETCFPSPRAWVMLTCNTHLNTQIMTPTRLLCVEARLACRL